MPLPEYTLERVNVDDNTPPAVMATIDEVAADPLVAAAIALHDADTPAAAPDPRPALSELDYTNGAHLCLPCANCGRDWGSHFNSRPGPYRCPVGGTVFAHPPLGGLGDTPPPAAVPSPHTHPELFPAGAADVDPGPGYRILPTGTATLPTDEIEMGGGEWMTCEPTTVRAGVFRRRTTPPATTDPRWVPAMGDMVGWEFLPAREDVIIQASDEFWSCGFGPWTPASHLVGHTRGRVPFRRRIGSTPAPPPPPPPVIPDDAVYVCDHAATPRWEAPVDHARWLGRLTNDTGSGDVWLTDRPAGWYPIIVVNDVIMSCSLPEAAAILRGVSTYNFGLLPAGLRQLVERSPSWPLLAAFMRTARLTPAPDGPTPTTTDGWREWWAGQTITPHQGAMADGRALRRLARDERPAGNVWYWGNGEANLCRETRYDVAVSTYDNGGRLAYFALGAAAPPPVHIVAAAVAPDPDDDDDDDDDEDGDEDVAIDYVAHERMSRVEYFTRTYECSISVPRSVVRRGSDAIHEFLEESADVTADSDDYNDGDYNAGDTDDSLGSPELDLRHHRTRASIREAIASLD